ncbi:sugar ABC transporter ATP-binding protein [Achromobacter sp. DMS1]|uniref:ABC transporter ATP-binding protein n=1 Tax=Achromobacter sp. DMS1 TaxID=1688405 RepID=UPI00069F2117|nr:ABC transporter ATP-binding protein [Achromobacter sp. DMS1]KOF54186.1 sugar ABC transporter ATP-binding protein [Achromobacter sp. DMS1]KOF54350.1 sugar ABC transporter ATP-binding protein [Achromobacter sp. DMS1]
MSSDIVITVENLSKCYQIYSSPRDRLKQFFIPNFQRAIGSEPRNYFREFWALRDVSFEVKKGESVGILGRNGSGKSTLLQMICGTLSPTAGSVETKGRIAALLELGSGFNPEFTGRENVYMNGALLGLSGHQVDDRFDAIASFADIGDFIDQPVKTYSSGMLIRLAFAVQVQVEPDILVVDEALAVGDALFQKRCFRRIEKLVSDGTTLLFVSHDQESVRTLTSRALLLKQGRTVTWGKSSDVVLEYRRQLHDEESSYFTAATKQLAAKAQAAATPEPPADSADQPAGSSDTVSPAAAPRSDKLSFGDGEVKIVKVETLNGEGQDSTVFFPGDEIRVRITCEALRPVTNLNVGVRIRNKEGIKIYSWGTLNQDMRSRASASDVPMFWEKKFSAGETFSVELSCDCPLGMNLYEIQATVTFEETPDYMAQRVLHWIDEAAFFQVLMNRDVNFFGGVADLRMNAKW